MSSSHAGPDRPVLLPSGLAWNTDARVVGEVLEIVGAAAARCLDDSRYLAPALTWQVAAELVSDCVVTTDYRPENVRALCLPAFALEAVWACHAALVQAAEGDDDGERLAGLLSYYLDGVHGIYLRGLIGAVERVLAVLSLDLPAARTLVTHLVLNSKASPESGAARDEVLAAWRRAGIAC
ncbi:hypothetical protein [Streptomyces sp. URMC 123]|uniref:hypothetical protein n=1 Tax=Streptomyces sp. URMC 123 TaxID=3423403 RepID=UPI003F1DAFD4